MNSHRLRRSAPALAALLALACLLPLQARGGSAAATPSPADPAAARLVARVIDAYGGRPALERVHAYRMEGTIVAARGARSGPTARVFQRPDRLKVWLRYPDAPETRMVKGGRGWRASGEDPAGEVHGPMLDAMVLQACRAGVPWVLLEHGGQARTAPARSLEGRSLAGFELSIGEGLVFRAWVDPGSGRVRVSQGELAHAGMRTQFETVYEDWRRVGGVWFAHHEENYASGAHTGTTVFRTVVLNPALRADEFAPPVPGPAPNRGDTL